MVHPHSGHALLRAVLASTSNPLAVVDSAGLLLGASPAFHALTELAGDPLVERLELQAKAAVEAALSRDEAGSVELASPSATAGSKWSVKAVSADGQTFAILSAEDPEQRSSPAPSGEVPWQDLANATSESQALSDAIDYLPIGVALLEISERDSSPRLLAHNSAYARLRGVAASEVLPSVAPSVTDADGRPMTADELPAVVAARTGLSVSERILRFPGADGRIRTVVASAAPVATQDGTRRGVGVMVDITDRARAEEARRASDQRCASFFAALQDPSGVFEAVPNAASGCDWVYREANEALLRQLGMTREQLVGQRLDQLFPTVAERLVPLLDSARGPVTVEHETAYGGHDFLVRGFSLGPNEVVITALDITERKATERALRQSTKRFETTAMTVPGALYDYVGMPGTRGSFVYLSPGAEDIFETPLADLARAHDSLWRCVVFQDDAALRAAHARVEARGEVECRIVTPRGTKKVLRFSWRASHVEANGAVNGSGFILDVTDAVATRHALDRSRHELTSLVERLPIGLFLERHGNIVYANPELAHCSGHYCATDLVGVPTNTVFAASSTLEDPFSSEREWSYRRPDGTDVVLVTSPRRNVEFEGQSAGLVTVSDHTELRAIRARLMQADRLASVGLLAAGVAHEVNNPLSFVVASIEAMTDALKAQPVDEDVLRQGLADARIGAHRVRQVVRDLKTFSHARVDPDRSTRIDINALLDSTITMVQNEIRHRARLVKDYGRLPGVFANEARLGQVFVNLLVNAAQAVSEGGVDDNVIRVMTSTTETGHAMVEVSDSGTGIGQAALGRIFDPFFTTKADGVGTGLGLAICRTSIEAMGGTIEAFNLPTRGASFRITLPPHRDVAAPSPKMAAARRVERRRGRILIVDDELLIARSLSRMLGKEHDVSASTDCRPSRRMVNHRAHGVGVFHR